MRLVQIKAKGPAKIEVNGQTFKICRCGLTKDPNGLCDNSHDLTLDEKDDMLYVYDEETMAREEVFMVDDNDDDSQGGCCGGHGGQCGCGHNHHHDH